MTGFRTAAVWAYIHFSRAFHCALLLIVPVGIPYGRCWKIYCCHSGFCHFLKCAALHNDGVGKILPYYPIKVGTSESAAFIFRQLVSCTIFILLEECCSAMPHYHLLGKPQAESDAVNAHSPWSSLPLTRSLCNRDWFLCLSLMTLYDCCV